MVLSGGLTKLNGTEYSSDLALYIIGFTILKKDVKSPMIIIAVRHGQTDWNAEERIQGRTDISLNEVGRKQAQDVAESLPETIDLIISSPLKRARETAEIINARFGTEIVIDERLIERNFGEYEGMLIKDVDMASLRRWTDNTPTPNGETIQEVAKRVFECLEYIKINYQGQNVLIVAHGHVLRPINWYFNGLPQDRDEAAFVIKTGGFYSYCID